MRCRLGEKKLRTYSKRFGKDFTLGLVRGGTDHRVDLYTAKESFSYYPYLITIEESKTEGFAMVRGEKKRCTSSK